MNETETDKRRETDCPSSTPDEAQLVDEVYRRSEAGLNRMMDSYGALLQSLSMSILHDAGEAEECVNDAYLGAWNAIPPARPNPLLAYLCKIVRNLSLKRYYRNTAAKRNSAYEIAMQELEPQTPDGRKVYGASFFMSAIPFGKQ